MCATSLRFFNDQVKIPVELNVNIQVSKDQNMKNLTVDPRNPAVFLKNCLCAFCLQNFETTKVIEMTYETIYEKLKDPIPIYNLYPKVSHDDIKKLRKNKQFAKKKTFACFDCYVEFTVLEEKNDRQLPLIGTGPLRPSKLKNTRGEMLTSTKYSELGIVTSRSSAPLQSLNSPLMASNSYSMIQPLFSSRTSKTAGGELFLKIPKKVNNWLI